MSKYKINPEFEPDFLLTYFIYLLSNEAFIGSVVHNNVGLL